MKKLIIASHNAGKLREFRALLPDWIVEGDAPVCEETEDTFLGNAFIKARALRSRRSREGGWILADDSGLCVDALGGAPGVRSARYAGEEGNTPANNALLLRNLEGVANRAAHFSCAIALIDPEGREYGVEGACPGHIDTAPHGENGFGYDPLFIPEGFTRSFAELSGEEKNAISHRGRALQKALVLLNR